MGLLFGFELGGMPPPPKEPENDTKSSYSLIYQENKATITYKSLVLLLVRPQASELLRLLLRNCGTSLKFGPSQSPLSGSAINGFPTFRRNFYKKGRVVGESGESWAAGEVRQL